MFGSAVRCLAVTGALLGLIGASDSAASDPPIPPAPSLTTDAGTIVAGSGSFCWKPSGATQAFCGDTFGPVTSKRPLVVQPGRSIRVDMKIAVLALSAALVPPSGPGSRRLGVRVLDTPKRHWRIRLPARLPRGWLLSLGASYPEGGAHFGARLVQAPR